MWGWEITSDWIQKVNCRFHGAALYQSAWAQALLHTLKVRGVVELKPGGCGSGSFVLIKTWRIPDLYNSSRDSWLTCVHHGLSTLGIYWCRGLWSSAPSSRRHSTSSASPSPGSGRWWAGSSSTVLCTAPYQVSTRLKEMLHTADFLVGFNSECQFQVKGCYIATLSCQLFSKPPILRLLCTFSLHSNTMLYSCIGPPTHRGTNLWS